MTSRKLSWQVEHWHFSIQVMKTIFLTWHSMAVTRMTVTLVVVMRSLMAARMTSVLMGVVTVVVTRWSRTLTRERNWWFWKVAISTGISTTFLIAISKNKYCYIIGETAGSSMTYTSIMLWPAALDRKYTNYSVSNAAYQHIKSKDTLEYKTEYTQIFYHLFVMYLFSYTKANKSFSVDKIYNRLLSSK